MKSYQYTPYGVHADGFNLIDRKVINETEKITINIGAIDLGQIDLLVEQGFYSNRTIFDLYLYVNIVKLLNIIFSTSQQENCRIIPDTTVFDK